VRTSEFLSYVGIFLRLIPLGLMHVSLVSGQATPEQLRPILSRQVQPPGIAEFQLRQYLMSRVPLLRVPATSEEWTIEARKLRKHL
jgi:hypothetical protein